MAQILIFAAILALTAMAGLQMTVDNKKFGEAVSDNQDMAVLASSIVGLLQNEESCRKALGGPPDDCFSGVNPTSCPVPDPPTAQTMTTAITNPPTWSEIIIYHMDGTVWLNSATDPGNTFGRLTINSIALTPEQLVPGTTDVYFARLRIIATKRTSLIGARQLLRNSQRISVRVRGGRIYSCNGVSFFGTDYRPLPICQPGEGLFMKGAIRCVRLICPVGMLPGPPDPGGNVSCTWD